MSNYISIILPKFVNFFEMSHLIRVIACFSYKFDINYFEICSSQIASHYRGKCMFKLIHKAPSI